MRVITAPSSVKEDEKYTRRSYEKCRPVREPSHSMSLWKERLPWIRLEGHIGAISKSSPIESEHATNVITDSLNFHSQVSSVSISLLCPI